MDVLGQVRIADVADILIVAILVYATINLIRGTRAVQMAVGLAVLAGVYALAQSFELYTLSWILRAFLGSFFLLIVVLFQDDIRRVLTRVGRARLFGGDRSAQAAVIDEVTRAATELAGKKIGALIVLERDVGLSPFLESGIPVDAEVSWELLTSIFHPQSPMHDGAAIVRNGRLAAAGCFLPLTHDPTISRALGSRHRAAIGISEESDAAVVVVSEELGRISLVHEGEILRNCDAETLRTGLERFSLS
ncbi:MAG: diadenylate cyclase CdaA [Alphaproteobacteria bacterium]